MAGIIYGIGVGPGDPELITLKALRLLKEADLIAVPTDNPTSSVAYHIALQALPQLKQTPVIGIQMPMTSDLNQLKTSHLAGAKQLETYLDQNRTIAFLTLGDITIYSSFSYLQQILIDDGYTVSLCSGIPSFCAAAASLQTSLVTGKEALHIYPASPHADFYQSGTCVFMKSGKNLSQVKECLQQTGRSVVGIENCGMEHERVFHNLDEIPDVSGYFTLLIAKES